MKVLRNLFISESANSEPDKLNLDPELLSVLKELKIKEFGANFVTAKCLYEDLPNLTPQELRELVPIRIPRGRLKQFIRKTFLQSKDNGWELDKSLVTFNVASVVKRGSYGKIKVGSIKVGIGSIPIAVKELQIDGRTITKDAVIQEVMVMSKLRHVNIVGCFGCWFEEDDRTAYIAMEYCPKGDLAELRKKKVPITPEEKIKILLQISMGMQYIHSKGMVHRDLKPNNVLLASDGETMKICDFGTTKMAKQTKGTLCGTPIYLSPEQFEGEVSETPTAIDIYSFGIIAWEIWTGILPFKQLMKANKDNSFKLLMAIHATDGKSKPVRPSLKDPGLRDCPDELIDLMVQCWETKIEKRPVSFKIIKDELEFILSDLKFGAKLKLDENESDDDILSDYDDSV